MTRRAPPAQQQSTCCWSSSACRRILRFVVTPPSRTRRRVALASRFVMSGPEEASRFAREEAPPPSLVPPPATTARSDGASPAPGLSSGGSFEAASPANSASGGLSAHVRSLGWEEREFSDVAVTALGKTYPLHRLVLSRSPYFRALIRGPWADASSPSLTLTFDDPLIDGDAVDAALGFLYDKLPGLTCDSAPRVLAAASYLDLQDLCVHCVDFIVEDVRAETILGYQTFAESHQPYGPHGGVRAACWGFLCFGRGRARRVLTTSAGRWTGCCAGTTSGSRTKPRGTDSRGASSATRARGGRARSGHRRAGDRNDEERKTLEENEANARGERSEDVLEADIARGGVEDGRGDRRRVPDDSRRRASRRERRRGEARASRRRLRSALGLFATRRRSARSARPRRTSRWMRRSR